MKHYQDSETGQIYAFEDDYDPLTADNRNIPKTLTTTLKEKPSDSSVWYQGDWIEQAEAPPDYVVPISSIPSYNHAWMAHLTPYLIIDIDTGNPVNFSLDEINNNSYDGSQLAKVVGLLPLGGDIKMNALISCDGTIAIPAYKDLTSRYQGIAKLNEILCSLLLGGIHTEALRLNDLTVGCLHEKSQLFSYIPNLHSSLRLNWASLSDRSVLIHPRRINLQFLQDAFSEGNEVIKKIPEFSSLLFLNGYTSLFHHKNFDALTYLWIVVEQLTVYLWENIYLNNINSYSRWVRKYQSFPKIKSCIEKDQIFAKHNLLRLARIITKKCHGELSHIRIARNNLIHRGILPNRKVVINLWSVLLELIEIASRKERLWARNLTIQNIEDEPVQLANKDFSDWTELSNFLEK